MTLATDEFIRRFLLHVLLWRTHDRHRGVRTLEAAPRTAEPDHD